MILVASGDSFIWGSELSDSPHCGDNGFSRKTFSALLSSDSYVCAAFPGIGNQEILNKTVHAIDKHNPDFVLVCWTWPTRDDKVDSDTEIIKLQTYLKKRNLPYLFTCVDNCVITNNSDIDYDVWFLFPAGTEANETTTPRGFYQWAVENRYQTGIDGHPLEDAHSDAAKLLKEKFNELVSKHT